MPPRSLLAAVLLVALAAVASAAPAGVDPGPGVTRFKDGLRLRMDCHNLATDARLPQLADFKGATELWLAGHDGFTGSGLAVLAKLPQVRELQLTGENVTAAGLKHLAGHPGLKTLWLHLTPVTVEGAGHVAAIPNLESLVLKYQPVEPAAWARLAKAPKLRTLTLWPRAPMADAEVDRLGVLTGLTEVRVMGEGRIDAAQVERLRRLLPAARLVTAAGVVEPDRQVRDVTLPDQPEK